MGLAASQARLLTITSRKADCEFQSMKLSHEKIALSRDMERISDEYQAAMNKTKLVYDYYGSGTSEMNLNYGLLMSPSVYNDYYPKILTDNKNRAVLSGPLAAAVKAAGVPKEGYNGTPSSEIRNKFVEALKDYGVISATTAANIQSVTYNNGIGLGATFSAAAMTQDITYDDLLEIIKGSCVDTVDYGLKSTVFDFGGRHSNETPYLTQKLLSQWQDDYDTIEEGNPNTWSFRLSCDNGDANQEGYTNVVSLYDLLINDSDKQYTVSVEAGGSTVFPMGESALLQRWLIGTENEPSFLNWMSDQFSLILGGVAENDSALEYAYNQVYDMFYPNEKLQEAAKLCLNADYYNMGEFDNWLITNENVKYLDNVREICGYEDHSFGGEDASVAVRNIAEYYIGGAVSIGGLGTENTCLAINLNNVAKVFLTAYKEYLEGVDRSSYRYDLGKVSDANLYDPQDDDIFHIAAPADVTDNSSNLVAGFYDALFNRICMAGWTENDNITDQEYMQELLKNGAVYLSSIGNDGMYYQSSYNTDTYISEVADTEGIAKAEARYNSEKARIEHKENTIDVKMKNLDTEVSSLTTEYETMKNVISKTIEKTFKRYEA